MNISDMLLTGMDIPREVRRLLNTVEASTVKGMTSSEHKAYKMGVENTLSAMKSFLNQDEHIVFHLEGHDCIEEFDIDDLITIIRAKECY